MIRSTKFIFTGSTLRKAWHVNHDLQQDFMRSFNGPRYHCFNVETTTIAVDLMQGRTCFGRHSEVALNTYLAGKEVHNHGTMIIEKLPSWLLAINQLLYCVS